MFLLFYGLSLKVINDLYFYFIFNLIKLYDTTLPSTDETNNSLKSGLVPYLLERRCSKDKEKGKEVCFYVYSLLIKLEKEPKMKPNIKQ